MNELSLSQSMLARHVIELSFVAPALTNSLPTLLTDAQDYLNLAENQQARLLRPLGIDPKYLTAFAESGGTYEHFFEAQGLHFPWYATEEGYRDLVVQDVAVINRGIRGLRKILGFWTSEEAALASDYALSPFSSIMTLNGAFGALASFRGIF